jgi:hypothetical protein
VNDLINQARQERNSVAQARKPWGTLKDLSQAPEGETGLLLDLCKEFLERKEGVFRERISSNAADRSSQVVAKCSSALDLCQGTNLFVPQSV